MDSHPKKSYNDKSYHDKKKHDNATSLDEILVNYKKLNINPRNFTSYFFIDRYSIIYMSNVQLTNPCETSFKYNVMDTFNETFEFKYNIKSITKLNEVNIENYTSLLRQFVANRHPPYLCIVKNQLSTFVKEILTNNISRDKTLSLKNMNDLLFQIFITLYCIYKNKFTITNIILYHIFTTSPVTLVYKIGNLQFILNDVYVFPFFSINDNSIITDVSTFTNPDQEITDSYNKQAMLILNSLYNHMFPYTQEKTCECLLAHLIMLFANKSNICRFDVMTDKKNNKYINEFCLKEKIIGNVYKYGEHTVVSLGNNLFFNMNTGFIETLNKDDLILLYDIKDTKPDKAQAPIFTFEI